MNSGRTNAFTSIHRALADPLRLRLLDALWLKPRSVKELSQWVDIPPDRLYYHLRRLEQSRLVAVGEHRRRADGKLERVYAVVESEPPTANTTPQETAQFLQQVLQATAGDIGRAYDAKAKGAERRVSLFRGAARLSQRHFEELRARFETMAREAQEEPDENGAWTRIEFVLIDLQDRRA